MRDYYILSVDSLVDSFSMMDAAKEFVPVSYTHLTLPTNREV